MWRALSFSLAILALALGCSQDSGPRRGKWVGLSPALTEILFEVGAGPEVVGVCSPVSYPEAALALPVLASWNRVDVERVLAFGVQACFSNTGVHSPEALSILERNGVAVHVFSLDTVAAVGVCLEEVGRLTGRAEQGRERAQLFRQRLSAVTLRTPSGQRPRAVVIVGMDPLVVAGSASFPSDVLRSAGFECALPESSELYPAVSLETLAAGDPRVLVLPKEMMSTSGRKDLAARLNSLLDHSVLEAEVAGDLLVRPGPRVVEGVEQLAAFREALEE